MLIPVKHAKSTDRNKHLKEHPIITDTLLTSFKTIKIDTTRLLRITNNSRCILMIQDVLTKYVDAHPIPSKVVKTIAETLVNQLITKYILFKLLKFDKGTLFKND